MKRHILLLAILCTCIISCQVEGADTPTREAYPLSKYASDAAESRVVFPLAMMETAFNIEAYENATAEEKVKMTYIFNCLLNQGNNYQMKNFYSFYLTPDGKSIHEPGAEWHISASNYGNYADYTLKCTADGKWEMTLVYENGQIDYTITQEAEDESLFNWSVSLTGSLTSGQGRVVEIRSDGPITRKVYPGKWECKNVMTGKLQFDIYGSASASAPQESFSYTFSGQEESNTYYQL